MTKEIDLTAISSRNIPKLPFESAAALIVEYGIFHKKEFNRAYKEHKIPKVVPRDPHKFYDNYSGWDAFIDAGKTFLINGKQPEENIPTYIDLKKKVKALHISARTLYVEMVKSGMLGDLAPLRPDIIYGKDFQTWPAFLAKPGQGKFLSFKDAQKKINKMGIKNSVHWFKFCREEGKPDDLPYMPNEYYGHDWKGWINFLNKK